MPDGEFSNIVILILILCVPQDIVSVTAPVNLVVASALNFTLSLLLASMLILEVSDTEYVTSWLAGLVAMNNSCSVPSTTCIPVML